ncbi:MAG: DUF1553 domain-containing protein [Verrucomicrobia bacterium]|nr:DUF1553 domain-containing protein [Verrucomicrobiota bacterium]
MCFQFQLWVLSSLILRASLTPFAAENQKAPSPIPVEPKADTSTSKLSHWAFRPLEKPAVRAVKAKSWIRNPIDTFILAWLERESLSPSPEADRITLIRRLSFDLLGLPPAPGEADRFVQDPGAQAYELLIERLLASPQYGERWARHWLDGVRFAETHGFEMNQPRPNAWPYRDYVIRAFNEDKPYDRFIFEQLAGDASGADEATGFLVGGPWDQVKSPDINLTQQQRMDELHDIVNTASATFLGLTVGCARCHDHKFDPISQTDYYAMQAVFAGVQHGERTLRTPDSDERTMKADLLRRIVENLDDQLAHFAPLANPALSQTNVARTPNPRENTEAFTPVEARFVRFTIHETLNHAEPCLDELEIFGAGHNSRNVALGAKASASGTLPNFEIHKLEHLNDGKVGNDHSWISNEAGRGWVQIELPEKQLINRIVWSRDRRDIYKDRVPAVYTIEVAATPNLWQAVAGRPPLRPPVHAKQNVDRFPPVKARAIRFAILESSSDEPCLDELEVYTAGDSPRSVARQSSGAKVFVSGNLQTSDAHPAEHLIDGQFGAEHSWISNERGRGWVQVEFPDAVVINKVVWSRDREGKLKDRVPTRYQIEVATDTVQAGEQSLSPDPERNPKSQISNFKFEISNQDQRRLAAQTETREQNSIESDRRTWKLVSSSNDREPFQPNAKPKVAYSPAGLMQSETAHLSELLAAKKRHEDEVKALMAFPAVYAGKFEPPGPTHRLNRGEPMQKQEIVAPGALRSIGPQLGLGSDLPEQHRRVSLARWMIDPKNPLTARVMVNRIWQHHFGKGLVDTPSDFGLNGSRPSHPELLDWLAGEFVASGWSVKAIHRLILSSSTYRQSSRSNPHSMAVDASDRLLWRYPPRRLEAEALRDSILCVSGNLDLKMGGPGFDLFDPNNNYVRVYNPKKQFGPPEWRRMVYQFKPRMRLDDVFGAFDCPDAGQITPKRTSSTTPLQALNLLNSPFVVQQAGFFAARLQHDAASDAPAQVRRAFRLAFSRGPTASEEEAGVRLIREEGLIPFCRALFNANEFIYVF